jgi:hypothetical protein
MLRYSSKLKDNAIDSRFTMLRKWWRGEERVCLAVRLTENPKINRVRGQEYHRKEM